MKVRFSTLPALVALTSISTLLLTAQLLCETGALSHLFGENSFTWPTSVLPYKVVLPLQLALLAIQLRFIFELKTNSRTISASRPTLGSILYYISRFYLLLLLVKSLIFLVAEIKGPSLGTGLSEAELGEIDLLSSFLPLFYKIVATGTVVIMSKKISESSA